MSLLDLFRSKPSEAEETRTLIQEVRELRDKRGLADDDAATGIVAVIMELVAEQHDATPGDRVGAPLMRLLRTLFLLEPFGFEPPEDSGLQSCSLAEGVELRQKLRRSKKMLENWRHYYGEWENAVGHMVMALYKELPPQAFVDPDPEGNFEEASGLAPHAPLYTFLRDAPLIMSQFIAVACARDLAENELFHVLRERLLVRLCLASGIKHEDRWTTDKQYVFPAEKEGLSDEELVELYLRDTPLYELFTLPLPLHIPEAVRFEHTHIIAGTGHGKTQTLQFLIAADLARAMVEKRSVVVMDSQGDLLQTLMRMSYFDAEGLRDRFVYIDPTELERPVGLNLFDFDLGKLSSVTPVERETILNGTVELYEYFFGALLGAELTQKQGVLFRYLATLLMRIPNANIHTLREVMENGERFKPYMQSLSGSARAFFETRFFDRGFTETKKQILNRIWGVLSNGTLDRMMGTTKNTVDLHQSLQNGSIVFINTAKDFLGEEGSVIFGRMFVALLGQALLRRAAIPKHERTPTYLYFDEAEDVIDSTLTRMCSQVRKYKGAMTFAHQNLDQLELAIRAEVAANTSIKLAGGMSAKDANSLAGDFRCDAGFLLAQRKGKYETQFACYAKNITTRAVTLSIPFGYVESMPKLDKEELDALLAASRERYGVPYVPQEWREPEAIEIPQAIAPPPKPVTPTAALRAEPVPELLPLQVKPIESAPLSVRPAAPPPPVVKEMGQGGVKHKYLQHLVKELGEERGFRVAIEEEIHGGAGRVDAVLVRGEIQLAFEISVTTTRDHELGNIEKCLALPYTHIVMLTSHKRRQTSLANFIGDALEDADKKRVSYLLPEDLPGFLDGYPLPQQKTEKTVKGYTVKSKVKAIDPAEALARRKAIAQVLARSIQAD